jgi:hypothetical protein
LIDPHAELTPNLRSRYYRNKETLAEIGVWIPVLGYVAYCAFAFIPAVLDSPPELILANAEIVKVSRLLPLFGMIIHLAGLALLVYGATQRRLGTKVRFATTINGLMAVTLSSFSYIEFMGKKVEVSQEGLFMTYVYTLSSPIWVILAVWTVLDAKREAARK